MTTSSRGWWVVAMLTVAVVFSFLDRGILALLVEPIKSDLGISDTQISLLLGVAFAAFYAIMGIPFGILVDRVHRIALIAGGFLLWTVATAASGLTRTFSGLFLMRMGVGVGQATLAPAAPSVIADSVPRERLASALSIYATGIYIGAGLATVVGGGIAGIATGRGALELPLIGLVRPWQLAFLLVGTIGLLPLALLVATVREPPRRGAGAERAPSFAEVKRHYRRHGRVLLLYHVGFTVSAFSGYGVGSWLPSFMVRSFGWSIGKTGLWLGINAAVTASVSVIAGGLLADRWYKQGRRDANLRVPLLGSLLWTVPGFGYLLAPSGEVAMVFLVISTLVGSIGVGCAGAALQELMPNRMRGQAAALYAVIANLVGLGLGPTGVALLTDYVFRDPAKLRYSLVVVAAVCHAITATCLWLSLRPYRESVAAIERSAAAAAP